MDMGLVLGLAATGALVYWVSKFKFSSAPLLCITLTASIASFLIFFWGALVPSFGRIHVHVGPINLDLWLLGGMAFVIAMVVSILVEDWGDRRRSEKHAKAYRKDLAAERPGSR
jgi:hypothetical protein